MDKNVIKKHLTERFLSEEKTPGINVTDNIKKLSKKINDDGVKAIEKDVVSYDKKLKSTDPNMGNMAKNKYNYTDDAEKTYHDELEIMNGMEMLEYASEVGEEFQSRSEEGLVGSSRMGNKGGKDMGNAEEAWGASSDDFGKNLVKRVKDSSKKRAEAEIQTYGMGDVQIPTGNKVQVATTAMGAGKPKGDTTKKMKSASPTVKETYVNEISTGLAAKAYSAANQKLGTDLDPFERNKRVSQADKFDRYLNPELKKQMKEIGGSIINKFNNGVQIAFDPYGLNVFITPDGMEITKGEVDKLPTNISIRIGKLVKKIQADMKIPQKSPNALEQRTMTEAEAPEISDKNKQVLTNWIEKFGAKEAAEKLINALSSTGMVSDLPDSMEYGEALNKIEGLLSKGNFDMAHKSAKSIATKLEKKAMKDMFGEEVEPKDMSQNDGEDYEKIGREVEYGINPHSEMNEPNENNDNVKIKESMKRLKFKKEFNGVGNALKMIPEGYKVDDKEFEMTDGNETYRIRWEGNLSEGKAVVLTGSDKNMIKEDMQKMKHLMGYKSQETLGLVKGNSRINENSIFSDIYNKSKVLLEGEDIESVKAKTGKLEDIKKKAPEATKHVQGKVSKDKMIATAKEGEMDDAVSHAPEAKEHVEGSVSTEKGTKAPAAKKGEWEGIKKKAPEATKHVTMKESFMSEEKEEEEEEEEGEEVKTENVEATEKKAKGEKNWDEISVPHAADAKKHIHMGKESKAKMETEAKEENLSEGVTIGGIYYGPM